MNLANVQHMMFGRSWTHLMTKTKYKSNKSFIWLFLVGPWIANYKAKMVEKLYGWSCTESDMQVSV